MSFFQRLQNWISEPAPDLLFEITENSVNAVSPADPARQAQEIFSERAAMASPAAPNITKPQLYREALQRIGKRLNGRRRGAGLVIPDYAVRMAIIDLDEFPASEQERSALLRFRLRKAVPFHIDEAQLSYSIQRNEPKQMEVLVVTIARPILHEYEGVLAEEGFRVGLVVPSSLASLRLCPETDRGLTVMAKMAGSTLSVLLLDGGRVRVVRCMDMAGDEQVSAKRDEETVIPVLQQTLAYAEDQLRQPATRLLLCGFGTDTEALGRRAQDEFGIVYAPLRSKFGAASQANAGLLGL